MGRRRQLLRLAESVADFGVVAPAAEDGSQATTLVWGVAPVDGGGTAWGHAATARHIAEHCPITLVGVRVASSYAPWGSFTPKPPPHPAGTGYSAPGMWLSLRRPSPNEPNEHCRIRAIAAGDCPDAAKPYGATPSGSYLSQPSEQCRVCASARPSPLQYCTFRNPVC